MIGFLTVLGLLFLIVLGVPVGLAFLVVGLLGATGLLGLERGLSLLSISVYQTVSSSALVAIPMFVLMGFIALNGALVRDLYSAGYKWVGRFPGGLAIATVFACAGFGFLTGSSTAGAAAMGTIAWPEMKRHGYSPRLALGTIAAAGSLGILIPPSIGMMVYGIITEQSITKLFMAGILPGFLVALTYCILVFIWAKLNPGQAPAGASFSWRERLGSLKGLWPVVLTFLLVMGGLYGGFFSPGEAGAAGAFIVFLVALIRRGLSRKGLADSLAGTVRLSGMIFLIIVGVMYFNSFIALTRLPESAVHWVSGLGLNRYVILSLVLALYIPLGMFIDAIGMMVLTLPFVFPLIAALGFDGIWFGVLIIRMAEVGVITPPLALNVYTVKGVVREVPLEEIFRGVLPFVLVDLAVTLPILVAFPQISLFLPNTMR